MDTNTPHNSAMASLQNQFLIAMPTLNQSFFSHTISLMCNHDESGAMGLIINQPLDVPLGEIFSQVGIDDPEHCCHADAPVLCGGPVQADRGFVLHSPEKRWDSTLPVSDKISLTVSLDVIHAIARGDGPDKFLVMLGYAGWDGGQLEEEIADNAWLTAAVDPAIVFDTAIEQRWSTASQSLGINLDLISNSAGHA